MKTLNITTMSLALLVSAATTANAGFIYHDSAITDGGEFAAGFPLTNLKNSGHTSPLDTEDANAVNESYASSGGAIPVTITLEFNEATELSAFYLWNHTNNGGGNGAGMGDFTLTFFDDANAGGNQVGAAFSDTAAAAAPGGDGTYAAEVFNFGTTYSGVRSATLLITNRANGTTSSFVAIRELGFEQVPEPSSLALLGLGGLLVARRRRG